MDGVHAFLDFPLGFEGSAFLFPLEALCFLEIKWDLIGFFYKVPLERLHLLVAQTCLAILFGTGGT